MFCADYIAAFIHHGFLTIGIIKAPPNLPFSSRAKAFYQSKAYPWTSGAASGFLAAASVYPFDFVRKGVISDKHGAKFIHSLSTVPYAMVFFGLYFSQRNPASLKSQGFWAFLSAFCAAAIEVPFDKAKLAMMQSRKTMLGVSALYVPFGAFMLILYDKAVLNIENRTLKLTQDPDKV